MDPNANLEEQRRIREWLHTDCAPEMRPEYTERVARLAELGGALDAWLCGGGFLPAAYEQRGLGFGERGALNGYHVDACFGAAAHDLLTYSNRAEQCERPEVAQSYRHAAKVVQAHRLAARGGTHGNRSLALGTASVTYLSDTP